MHEKATNMEMRFQAMGGDAINVATETLRVLKVNELLENSDEFIALGHNEEALKCLMQAAEIEPTEAWLYCDIALVLLRLGRQEKAMSVIATAKKIDKKYVVGWLLNLDHLLTGSDS